MSSHRRTKKKPRPDPESESESEGEEDDRVLFYVPSAGINIEVLVFYIKLYLGSDSDAEPGRHPQRRDEVGYYVRSRLGLSAVMIADLKKDTAAWKLEKERSKYKDDYIRSVTAATRRNQGASGRPNVPPEIAERAAKRGESKPASGKPIAQASSGGQPAVARHQDQRDTPMTGASPPFRDPYMPLQSSVRHQDFGTQAQTTYPGGNFVQPTTQTSRHAQPYVNVSVASYSVNAAQRHTSPPQGQSAGVLPSIEGRFGTPAPPYTEDDDRKPNRPSQPSTTGTQGWQSMSPNRPNQPSTTGSQGWQSMNPTAGPRPYQ